MTADLRHRLRKLEARLPEQPPEEAPGYALERLAERLAAARARGDPPSYEPLGECPYEPGSALERLWRKLEGGRRARAEQAS